MQFCRCLIVFALVPFLLSPHTPREELAEEAPFAAQARRLEPSNPLKYRLEAIAWLDKNHDRPAAAQIMPALVRCLKEDVAPKVRGQAVQVLAIIAKAQKPTVCPLAVVEAFEDKSADVRSLAGTVSGLFTTFAPGSVDVLLRCMKNSDRDTKGTAVGILGQAYGKDNKILAVIRAATTDKDCLVRHNAQIALFNATGRLEGIVSYYLRLRLELPEQPAGVSEEDNYERCRKNMIRLAVLFGIHNLAQEQTAAVGKLVIGQLGDADPVTRQAAVHFVGEYAAEVEGANGEKLFGKKDEGKETPPRGQKLSACLQELKVEEHLRKLAQEDPSPEVRTTAAAALKRLAERR